MQTFEFPASCSECKGPLVDAVDELVCQRCGVVMEKEVLEIAPATGPSLRGGAALPLGSFLGPARIRRADRLSEGFSRANSTYSYLKAVSDFAGKEDSSFYACEKMTQRAAERFSFPPVVVAQAVEVSKKILKSGARARGTTLAAISAYGLIAACKIEGITSVSVREIVAAYTSLGRRVKASSLIQLSLVSPIKTVARRPEAYVGMIMARLSAQEELLGKLAVEKVQPTSFFNSLRVAAEEALAGVERTTKSGHRPSAMAATAVYAGEVILSTREGRKKRVSQRDLAQCSDSAEYTIREQYRQIFSGPVKLLAQPRSESKSPTSTV